MSEKRTFKKKKSGKGLMNKGAENKPLKPKTKQVKSKKTKIPTIKPSKKFNQLNRSADKKKKELVETAKQKAKIANEMLEDVREDHENFLRLRWNAILHEIGTKETKNIKSRFRLSTSKMAKEQLRDYINLLDDFMEDIREQQEDFDMYDEMGFGYIYEIIDDLAPDFYNYYYAHQFDEWVSDTKTVIQARLEAGQTIEEINATIKNAFYSYGNSEQQNRYRPPIGDYISAISDGGKYL